jgi:hypothetical protein
MEEASHPGYTPNRCRLAWRRLSAVLEMALQSSTDPKRLSAERAYELYEQRGRQDGHAVEDWLAAEAELMNIKGKGAAT